MVTRNSIWPRPIKKERRTRRYKWLGRLRHRLTIPSKRSWRIGLRIASPGVRRSPMTTGRSNISSWVPIVRFDSFYKNIRLPPNILNLDGWRKFKLQARAVRMVQIYCRHMQLQIPSGTSSTASSDCGLYRYSANTWSHESFLTETLSRYDYGGYGQQQRRQKFHMQF